jgi:hypothetical protein
MFQHARLEWIALRYRFSEFYLLISLILVTLGHVCFAVFLVDGVLNDDTLSINVLHPPSSSIKG